MVTVNIQTLGHERIIRSLSRIGQWMQDLRDPFETVASYFWTVNQENFDSQGKPEKFKPLSPNYKRWKDKHYPGKKILQLSGRLYDSLTAQNQADSQDTIKIITRKYAELGTQVPYADFHYYGTRKMPSRKPVQLADKHRVVMTRIIHRWAFGLFEKMGFEAYYEEFGGVV